MKRIADIAIAPMLKSSRNAQNYHFFWKSVNSKSESISLSNELITIKVEMIVK